MNVWLRKFLLHNCPTGHCCIWKSWRISVPDLCCCWPCEGHRIKSTDFAQTSQPWNVSSALVPLFICVVHLGKSWWLRNKETNQLKLLQENTYYCTTRSHLFNLEPRYLVSGNFTFSWETWKYSTTVLLVNYTWAWIKTLKAILGREVDTRHPRFLDCPSSSPTNSGTHHLSPVLLE